MKKIKVIDLFNIPYAQMSEKINEEMAKLQREGKEVLDFKVIGESLNKCAVFIMYDEELNPLI